MDFLEDLLLINNTFQLEKIAKERDLNQSRDKLVILYKSCGFKLIKDTKEFMVADLWNYIA